MDQEVALLADRKHGRKVQTRKPSNRLGVLFVSF